MIAAMLLAAIITERNDVYDGAGCYTPPAYTFIGTPSRPGIDSCWIPYGTYTNGVGDTEYTRVTSNLMGVVASALAGLDERQKALYDGFQNRDFYMLRPLGIPNQYAYWSDDGAFLESSTNRSLRIADQLNLPLMRVRHEGTNYTYTVWEGESNRLEPALLAAAMSYGSRRLDAMTGNVEPPISSEWSSKIPWSASDADAWRNVYPLYGLCTNDMHFLPDEYWGGRVIPSPFSASVNIPFWGSDAEEKWGELYSALDGVPLDFTLEDVLSTDTGWTSDDFAHWTNGTTRLDWKRLGIICQLERQMETTYKSFDNGDELPLWQMGTEHSESFVGSTIELELPAWSPGDKRTCGPYTNRFADVTWSREHEDFTSSTNNQEWSTPTCRTPAPGIVSSAWLRGSWMHELGFNSETDLGEFLEFLCGQVPVTNEISGPVEFWVPWHAIESETLCGVESSSCSAHVTLSVPSNTVTVTTSSGFDEETWRETPVADDWFFQDGNSWVNFYASSLPGAISLDYYDNYPECYLNYNEYSASHDSKNGSVTVPRITFTAMGSGPVTNWMWHLSGVAGLPDDSKCRRTITNEGVSWSWDGSPYTHVEMTFGGQYTFYFNENLDDGKYQLQVSKNEYADLPSSWTSPSVTVTWASQTAEREYWSEGSVVFDTPWTILGSPPSGVLDYTPAAYISKSASATFTYASEESREETIRRFSPSYSSLDWSRIYSLRRSELELLISARGDGSQAHDTAPSLSGDFTWNRIKDLSHSERVFRFLTGTTCTSLESANRARYNLLSGLSSACKSKCIEQGGMSIGSIESVGKITGSERSAFYNDLKKAVISGGISILPASDDEAEPLHISGSVHHNESGDLVVDAIYSPRAPCVVGSVGWSLGVSIPNTASNIYNAARADGYQAPARKTLWKFKNLRDPNL